MALRLLVLAFSASIALGGCAIRPLPEDVTRLDTFTITQRLRCEMRDAIREHARALIAEAQPEIAERLRDPAAWSEFPHAHLQPEVAASIDRYWQAVIAYEFKFNIVESNAGSATLGLIDPVTRGTFRLGLTGTNDRSRRNERTFRMVDTASRLVTAFDSDACGDVQEADHLYPITGRIGLAETVSTFFMLNESGDLVTETQNTKTILFVDDITFTTKLVASATPSLELRAVGTALQLGGFQGSLSATREDVHRVKISIVLPLDPPPARRAPVSRAISPQAVVPSAPRLTTPELQSLQQRALDALDEPLDRLIEQRVRDELRR